jgi:hypothetical protein
MIPFCGQLKIVNYYYFLMGGVVFAGMSPARESVPSGSGNGGLPLGGVWAL